MQDRLSSDIRLVKVLVNLFLLPASGTSLYTYKEGKWGCEYSLDFTQEQKNKIIEAMMSVHKPRKNVKIYGNIIDDRGSQITLSALGQEAPLSVKKRWDPTMAKRIKLVKKLQAILPDFEIRAGGASSVDVTFKGIDKSYGIRKILEYLDIPPQRALFIGDAIFEGGNDYPVKKTGVDYISVGDPGGTYLVVKDIVDGYNIPYSVGSDGH